MHRLSTLSIPEVEKLIKDISIKGKRYSNVFRIDASRYKAEINKLGTKCGFVDMRYSNPRLSQHDISFAYNCFPTTNYKMVYYSFSLKKYIKELFYNNNFYLSLTDIFNELPSVGKITRNIPEEDIIEYQTPSGVDCVGLRVSRKSAWYILDKSDVVCNPTLKELIGKMGNDNTNEIIYESKRFECYDFAIKLRESANIKGIRCAVILLFLGWEDRDEQTAWHAMNIFDTLDKGKIYIEPQTGMQMVKPNIGDNFQLLSNNMLYKSNPAYKSAKICKPSPHIIKQMISIW